VSQSESRSGKSYDQRPQGCSTCSLTQSGCRKYPHWRTGSLGQYGSLISENERAHEEASGCDGQKKTSSGSRRTENESGKTSRHRRSERTTGTESWTHSRETMRSTMDDASSHQMWNRCGCAIWKPQTLGDRPRIRHRSARSRGGAPLYGDRRRTHRDGTAYGRCQRSPSGSKCDYPHDETARTSSRYSNPDSRSGSRRCTDLRACLRLFDGGSSCCGWVGSRVWLKR